jgi:hypothetical protein
MPGDIADSLAEVIDVRFGTPDRRLSAQCRSRRALSIAQDIKTLASRTGIRIARQPFSKSNNGANMKKVKIPHPETRLVTIYHLSDPIQAELIKNTLADHGIECHLEGESQAGFSGIFEIGVLVAEEHADAAHEFIEIHHSHKKTDETDSGRDEEE